MSSQKWLKLSALMPSLAMVFTDQSILPVALPTIQRELGASDIALQWSVNSYMLTIAIFVLVAGKLSDRIGHRKALIWGIIIFALASAVCGMSPNIESLIAARLVQGMGAALIYPSQSALLAYLFAPHERGRATGLNVSVSSLFLIAGPLIGGYLTQDVSWRWIFWINLPIAIVGVILALALLPSPEKGHQKIDGWGFLFFAFSCSSIVVFSMQGEDWGWLSWPSLTLLAIAIVSGILLLVREKKTAHPFLDLSLFKIPIYGAINLSISITSFILMIGVFRAIYFQTVLGYTPSQAGLISFVSCIPILFLSPVAGFLADKISAKLPVAIGFLLLIFSFFWLGFSSTPGLGSLLTALTLFGVGIPFIFTPSYSGALSAVPPKKMGVGLGMVSTLRTLASTFGIALIGAFMLIVKNHSLEKGESAREADIASFSSIHFTLGFLLIIAFAFIFVLHRRHTGKPPESPAEGWN